MKRSFQQTTKKDDDHNYNEMKVKDLKKLVSVRGLSTKGLTRKEQLIRVLEQDDNKHLERELDSNEEDSSAESGMNLCKDESTAKNKVDFESPKKKQKLNDEIVVEKSKAVGSSRDDTTTFDDKTPLSDILRPEFDPNHKDEEAFYQSVVKQLHDNDLLNLLDWKVITDPKLKKKFGTKVINVLDLAAGKRLFDGNNIESIIDWFDRNYPMDEPRSEVKLVTTYGAEFPRVGRAGVAKRVREKLERRLTLHYNSNQIDKGDIFIPYVATLPGAGKSRINQDLIDELRNVTSDEPNSILSKHLRQPIKLLITFGSGGTLTTEERNQDITSVFAYRILYSYFVAGRDPTKQRNTNAPVSFVDFIKLMWSSSETSTRMIDAFEVIELYHRRSFNIDPSQGILIHVGVDEYQELGLENLKILNRQLGAMMTRTYKEQSYILSPFFSGTDFMLFFNSFGSSSFQSLRISIELLSQEEVTQMLDEMSVMEKYSWLSHWRLWPTFRRCIEDFQGYIRGIEMFLQICDEIHQQQGTMPIDDHDLHKAFERTRELFRGKQMCEALILFPDLRDVFVDVLLGRQVLRGQDFSTQHTYNDLERIGVVSLTTVKGTDFLQAKMPFIFFSLLAENGPREVFHYWSYFRECRWWQDWKEFNCIFSAFLESTLAYNQHRYSKMNITNADNGFTVTIAERFRGAYYSRTTGEKRISVYRDTRWARSRRQFPPINGGENVEIYEVSTISDDSTTSKLIDFNSPRHIILNTPSTESCHVFEWKEVVLAMQDKKKESRISKDKPVSIELITYEHGLNESTFKKFYKSVGTIDKSIITVILTDSHVSDSVIQWVINSSENIVLVCKQNFRDYYGDLFADRALFAAAQNHFRVNEMTFEELQNFEDVGPVIANLIVKERATNGPFKNWKNLVERVQQIPDCLKEDAMF